MANMFNKDKKLNELIFDLKEEYTHPAMKSKEVKEQTLEDQKQELEDSLAQS